MSDKTPGDNDTAQEFGESSTVERFEPTSSESYSPQGDEALGESSLASEDELAALDAEVSQQVTDLEREEQRQSLTEQVLSGDILGAGARLLGGEVIDTDAEQIQLAQSSRMREQCFLTYHIKQLTDLHRNTMLNIDILSNDDDPSLIAIGEETANFPRFSYKKTQILDSPTGLISEVMPKLQLRPGTEKLLDITTDQIANLVPAIKLYKTVYDENGLAYEVQFKFLNHDLSGLDPLGASSRSGVGIKSFDWQYISGNPDTVKKDITAKLVLFFQSMDELIKVRNTQVTIPSTNETKQVQYSYLDLVVNPGRVRPPTEPVSINDDTSVTDGRAGPGGAFNQYDGSEYEIKATVGWAYPGRLGEELSGLDQALSFNRTNLFLSLTDHQFNINQDGTFELVISYRSRLEGILESPKSNVLFCDRNIINNSPSFKKLIEYDEEIERLTSESEKCADNKKELEEAKKRLVNTQTQLRQETYKFMIVNLLEPERWYGEPLTGRIESDPDVPHRLIYSMLVDPEVFGLFADNGVMPEEYRSLDLGHITATKMLFTEPKNPKPSSADNTSGGQLRYKPSNPDEMIINFFYLGDLIDMLATTVFDNEKYAALPDSIRKKYSFNVSEVDNLKFLLGPVQFKDPRNGEVFSTNLADVPIGLKEFTDFFHRKVIKQQLTVYNFKSFIKDLLHDLMQTAFGKNCFEDIEQVNGSMRNSYVSVPVDVGNPDPILAKSNRRDVNTEGSTARVDIDEITMRNPLFNYSNYGNKSVSEHMHYVVLHMQSSAGLVYPGVPGGPQLLGLTPRARDLNRGIKHVFIGRDRGLLLSINFSKTNEPFLRQARLENAGSFDPILQLSDIYEADIEMMGNTFFYPGMPLYINAFGLGLGEEFGVPHQRGSLSNIMGLGGYHIVTHVSSYIESGVYKTNIKARFESNGDGFDRDDINRENSGGDCPEG